MAHKTASQEAEQQRRTPHVLTDSTYAADASPDGGLVEHDPERAHVPPAAPVRRARPPAPPLPRLLWDYRWLIAGTFGVLGVGGSVYLWLALVPQYRAEATLRISPVIPRLVFRTDDNGEIPVYTAYVNTKVATIRSPRLLQRVMQRDDVAQTAWYRSLRKPRWEFLDLALLVTPQPRSELVTVAAKARSAEDAALLANAVVDEFLRDAGEAAQAEDAETVAHLLDEREKRAARMREIEEQIAAVRRELGAGDADALLAERDAQLQVRRAELAGLREQIALAEWQRERIESHLRAVAAAAPEGDEEAQREARFAADAQWGTLKRELRALEHQSAIESDRFGPEHPTMKELARRIAFAEEALRERERQLASTAFTALGPRLVAGEVSPAATLDEARERLAYLRERERLMARDVAALKQGYDQTLATAERLKQRQAELKYESDLYEAVRTRISQKEVESRVLGAIRLHSAATPPLAPHQDRRRIFVALALVGSLALGIGGAWLHFGLSPRVRAPADLLAMSPASFVGALPILRAAVAGGESSGTLEEAVRILRTSLLDLMDRTGMRAFLVTSAAPGAGKTHVSMLLARSLTRCGKRVLLVDADLRHQRVLADRIGIPSGPGLVAELTGKVRDDSAVRRDVVPGLSVLPAGARANGAYVELLADGSLERCLERWKTRYDVVLIDGPPVLTVADARIIARQVDGALLVVREGHCRRDDVARAQESLRAVGGRLVGVAYLCPMRPDADADVAEPAPTTTPRGLPGGSAG